MVRTRLALVASSLVIALAACSGGSSPSPAAGGSSAAPSTAPSTAPSVASIAPSAPASTAPSAMPSASSSAEPSLPTAVPTAIDPCTLVTQAEASALAGVSLSKGKETTFDTNGKQCGYAATGVVFVVQVVQAPDQATVDKAKQQALKDMEQGAQGINVKVTQLSGIGDGAALLTFKDTVGGMSVAATGMYLLKGTVFVAFSDVSIGHAAPSSAAVKSQAQTVLGRLP